MRTDEGRDEALGLRLRRFRTIQHVRELRDVLVERASDTQEAAVLRQQVMEVQRAFLRPAELTRQREDRAPDDRGFDHRARVDADDRGGVIHRVEEARPVLFGDRAVHPSRPDLHLPEVAQVRVFPRVEVVGMRADEHGDVAHARILGAPQRLDPLPDERQLELGAGDEDRRRRVEQEGPVRRQADGRAELLARRARRALEPAIEQLRARHGDAAGRDAVVAHRLGLLRLVPHHHEVRLDAQQPLVRQVVPARDAGDDAHAAAACRADDVHLVRGRIDERRDDDDVRLLLPQERDDRVRDGHGTFEPAQQCVDAREHAGGKRRQPIQPAERPGQDLALHAVAERRRVTVVRVQVADEVERAAKAPRERVPAVRTRRHDTEHAHRAADVREGRLLLLAHVIDGNRDVVPARGQQPQHGVVVAEVFGRRDDEEEPHAGAPSRSSRLRSALRLAAACSADRAAGASRRVNRVSSAERR